MAVGEIGLDHFVPELQDEASRALQERIYAAQLDLAVAHGLPVILHVRRSADGLLKHLRRLRDAGRPVAGGIAFVAAGHHATERYGVQALGRHLESECGLEHQFIDIPNPV